MSMPDNPYYQQLRLLVRILPAVMAEKCFALKGGTAINLFYRDLPRYSVDIDLTYLPGEAYPRAMREMDAALRRIAAGLSSGSPSFNVTLGKGNVQGAIDTITVRGTDALVKVEVNPVLRSSVFPARKIEVRPTVRRQFGFANANVLSFEDTYAGKIVAALDRQHPRDLFDINLLLANEGISEALFKTFLVYLVGHKGVISHVLAPREKNIAAIYRGQFQYMTVAPVSLETLVSARQRLVREIHARFDAPIKQFLLSAQRGEPEWPLLGLDDVEHLPAIKWKLLNVKRMSKPLFAEELASLERLLEKIGK